MVTTRRRLFRGLGDRRPRKFWREIIPQSENIRVISVFEGVCFSRRDADVTGRCESFQTGRSQSIRPMQNTCVE